MFYIYSVMSSAYRSNFISKIYGNTAVLRGKLITIEPFLKKLEVNNLTYSLNELEKRRSNKAQRH